MHEKKTTPPRTETFDTGATADGRRDIVGVDIARVEHVERIAERDRRHFEGLAKPPQDPWKTAPKDRLQNMNRKDRRTLAAQARKAQSRADAKKREEAAAEKLKAVFAKDLEVRYARDVARVDDLHAALFGFDALLDETIGK